MKTALLAIEAEEKVLKDFISVTGGATSQVVNKRNDKLAIGNNKSLASIRNVKQNKNASLVNNKNDVLNMAST